jgi:hypothetical protein
MLSRSVLGVKQNLKGFREDNRHCTDRGLGKIAKNAFKNMGIEKLE